MRRSLTERRTLLKALSQIPVVYSTFAGDALAEVMPSEYDLESPVECRLFNRGFNDHYAVKAGSRRYMLRVYSPCKYWIQGPDDLRFELDLLTHLKEQGVPVAAPIRRRNGDFLGAIEAPEKVKYFALFHHAPGKAVMPMSVEQACIFGDATARFHLAADRFVSPHPRYSLDFNLLFDQPLEWTIRQMGPEREKDARDLKAVVEHLKARIAGLDLSGDAFGLIHVDLHGRNNHFTEGNELTLFDFDSCGYGYRAYDLGVFFLFCNPMEASQEGENGPWNAFLKGYEAHRPLRDAEREAIPTFAQIREFLDIGEVLVMNDILGDGHMTDEFWDREMKKLRSFMES